MSVAKIKWRTGYDIRLYEFGVQGEWTRPDGAIRASRIWVRTRELRMRGRLAVFLRRIQRALEKDMIEYNRKEVKS